MELKSHRGCLNHLTKSVTTALALITLIGVTQPTWATRAELPANPIQAPDLEAPAFSPAEVFALRQRLSSAAGRDLTSAELQAFDRYISLASAYEAQKTEDSRVALFQSAVKLPSDRQVTVNEMIFCLGIKIGLIISGRGKICVGKNVPEFLIAGIGTGLGGGMSFGPSLGVINGPPGVKLDGSYTGYVGGNLNAQLGPVKFLGLSLLLSAQALHNRALIGPDLLFMSKQDSSVSIGLLGIHAGPSAELISSFQFQVHAL